MRQLAAILFADIAGYTALVQKDEQLAKVQRRRLKEVLETTISRFNGRILQYYGDGSLSIFKSAIDAVLCSVDIQRQLQHPPEVSLRMGIHTGDITIEDDAVYGDGVNLASRIESLAIPGGILVSEKVFDEVRNQPEISTKEMGYFELKNIREPVRVFAVANDGIVVPSREMLKGKTKQPANRLAVLPFVNMSADPENEYFSDGITEELLNALTRVEGLQVTSRTSSFSFKGRNEDIREIGIKLNVDKILEGSVRKAGNRVRITAQLINARDGYHIWSENYDRNLTDIFAVQDDISGMIAGRLKENIVRSEATPSLIKSSVKNIEAYTLYLKGLHFWNKLTPADTRKAIECFDEAIKLEPGYAVAWGRKAMAYAQLGMQGQVAPKEAFTIAHTCAEKSVELDSMVAEGYIARAGVWLFYEWKWRQAYEALQKAIELNPAVPQAYQLLASYYIMTGSKDDAVSTMEDALKKDPLSTVVIHSLGNIYIFAERYDDTIAQADQLLEMDSQMRIAIELKGWAYGMKGEWLTAVRYFEEVHRLTGHPLKGLLGLGYASAKLGRVEEAMECIRKMEQRMKEEPGTVVDAELAGVWFALDNMDKTFYHIYQCIEKYAAPVAYFLQYPAYRGLEKDPRYPELQKRMHAAAEY